MKKKQFILAVFAIMLLWGRAATAQELKGIIRDKITREALPGAVILIPDLKTGTTSDADGKFHFKNLPSGKFLIQVRMLGYSTISQTLDLSIIQETEFELELSVIEKSEIVVTGSAFTTDIKKTSVAVTPIDKMQIAGSASDNLVQALSNIPGLSSINSGNAISKPVIRGLGFNRVVVVNEGIRQEGQQWGDEHGLEIDQFAADRIEILKGPSSLLYGSDALGGVINILEPVLPMSGNIRAEFSSLFSSVNTLFSNSAMTEGNLNGLTWRARGTYKTAGPVKTPVETVYNSAYREQSADVLAGLHKKWGYSHIHLSRWFSKIGITEGERDSVSGRFTDDEGNIIPESVMRSRTPALPFQEIEHAKLSAINNLIIGKSQVRFNIGLQQNNREEYTESADNPGLHLQLQTLTYDLKYYFPEKNNFETAIGISGMRQKNTNKGDEFLIPDYSMSDNGLFASIKKTYPASTINAGMRYDYRNVQGHALVQDTNVVFNKFDLNFSSVSASVGVTHEFSSSFHVKANAGRGFRAPNIPELSSNGIHEGTQRYEEGNTNLKPETSLQFDLGFMYESKIIEMSLNLFLNNIDYFIYSRNTDDSLLSIDGTDYSYYRYVQGQSTLSGGELTFDIHPIPHLHFENSVAYVRGQNEAMDQPLPFMPPLRVINELRYDIHTSEKSRFSDTYLELELISTARQSRTDEFEEVTEGYSILNAGIGTNLKIGKQKSYFYARLHNLFNTKYLDHMSRMKEISVHGNARGISVGFMIPVGLR